MAFGHYWLLSNKPFWCWISQLTTVYRKRKLVEVHYRIRKHALIARFMVPTWDPSGADRTQVCPHVGLMNFAIWVDIHIVFLYLSHWYAPFQSRLSSAAALAGGSSKEYLESETKWTPFHRRHLDKVDTISQTTFRQSGHNFADDIFKCIFLNENAWILITITLRFVPKVFQQWFRELLGAVQATSHYMNQWWLIYRRIYASISLNKLTKIQYNSGQLETETMLPRLPYLHLIRTHVGRNTKHVDTHVILMQTVLS